MRNYDEVYLRFERGERAKEIAESTGISVTQVNTKLRERYGSAKTLSPLQRQVRDLYLQGFSRSEIARATGRERQNVAKALKVLGLKYTDEQIRRAADDAKARQLLVQRRQGEERMIARINERGCFEYAGNYTGSDGHVDLRCKKCGSVFTASSITLRQGGAIVCKQCKENEKLLRAEEARQARIAASEERKRTLAREQEERSHRICAECGAPFVSPQYRKFCSEQCRRKNENRRKDARRRGYRRKSTLTKLYERDHGVCYICGRKCDFEDYTIRDGTFLVGQTYPTVEHVVPVCLGGDDEWDNVRLACFACNTKKSRHSAVSVDVSGQLSLTL